MLTRRVFRSFGGTVLGFVLAVTQPGTLFAQEPPRPAVIVSQAEISDLRTSLRFSGRLIAEQKVDIIARISGFLEEIGFAEGDAVTAGSLLYKIEAGSYAASVAQAEGSIKAAQAELRLAEIERDRQQTLVNRGTAAQSVLDIAIANLGKAEGQLAQLQGQLDNAKLDLEYTQVTAPFDGVIGLSSQDVGAFVGPEIGALTTLTRLDPMTVEFPLPSSVYLTYRQSQTEQDAENGGDADVSLLLPNGTTYPLLGKIDFIDSEVARGTDTVIVRAVFDNPDGILLDGALVGVELVGTNPELVLNIPQQAVQRDQVGEFVMVVDADDTVEQRRVRVQRTTQGRSVIAEGLEEGEVVVTEGINKVRPGIKVDAATSAGG